MLDVLYITDHRVAACPDCGTAEHDYRVVFTNGERTRVHSYRTPNGGYMPDGKPCPGYPHRLLLTLAWSAGDSHA